MNPKRTIVRFASLGILAGASILILIGRNPAPFIGIGIIVVFLLYVLWDMPDKHKDFTWEDQQKALFTSTGGNPPPEIPKPGDLEEQQQNAQELDNKTP